MLNISSYILFLAFIVCQSNALTVQDLGGQWQLTNGEIDINATVPGGIFSDLMASNTITDIFYERGDFDNRWVGESNWTYSTTFTIDEDVLNYQVILLVFEGLDTFATISINGVEVGSSNNMFVRYYFSVKQQLQVGENEIVVSFTSSVAQALALAEDPNNEYLVPPECPPTEYQGICHVNRIRKMQASYSWDWGPAFASVGIWKDVYLQAFDNAVIDYVAATPTQDIESGNWSLWVSVFINGGEIHGITASLDLTLETNNGKKRVTESLRKVTGRGLILTWNTWMVFTKDEVDTWWPNGYGDQPLYNLTASLFGNTETSTKSVRVGFRNVELVQDEIDSGRNFYFKINNVPIFAKGSNEIPVSVLPEKGQDRSTIQRLMQTVRDSNMNILRVWGGGVYESDYFYDLADEYGIMIWQDFMFACAMYPTDSSFLQSVTNEVHDQVFRLTSHPSVIIWSGNNENEGALRQNWYGTGSNFSLYEDDYVKLYIDTIKAELLRNAPNNVVNFITSSPTNGLASDDEGYVAENPADSLFGDVHFYDYGSDSWNVATYPIPRFASEYGFQSYPSLETWLTATDDLSNLAPLSDFMEFRQHHPGGNTQNLALIQQQLQLPDNESSNYVAAVIYFSQILQAQAIKTETEHYRSFKGRLDTSGRGNTMGALYWQLNDVWVAPTWSGIDFTGRWKMLQYFTKIFFNPLIITGRLTSSNDLEVYAILDALEVPTQSLKALVRIYSWDNVDSLVSVEFPVDLDTSKSVLVTTLNAPQALNIAGCGSDYDAAKTKCFFRLHIVDNNNEDVSPVNYVFPGKLKESQLSNATVQILSVSATNDDNTEFEIEVSSSSIALFVWLDSHDIRGTFSENGFLQVESSKTVVFAAEEATDADTLTEVLTVTHLRDSVYL